MLVIIASSTSVAMRSMMNPTAVHLILTMQCWWLDMEQLGMGKTTGLSKIVGESPGVIRDTSGKSNTLQSSVLNINLF